MIDEDAPEGDALDNLIRELRIFRAKVAAMEPTLSARIRRGVHEDLQQELADDLGVAPAELDDAFLPEGEPESELSRRLHTGQQ